MFSELEITGRSRTHIVQLDRPRFAATATTAMAFLRLRETASADGIDLIPYASFRDFSAQLRIWNKKFSGKKVLYDLDEQKRDFAVRRGGTGLGDPQLALAAWGQQASLGHRHRRDRARCDGARRQAVTAAVGGMYPEPWHLSYAGQSLAASQVRTYDLPAGVIEEAEILGKQTILKLLPDILTLHVRNVATPAAPGEIVNFGTLPPRSRADP